MFWILCVTFSAKIWSKEAQGYKSNILLLLYQYVFMDVFFRKIIIEIWEINPSWTNSSINGRREQAFTEIVGYFCNKEMCYESWLYMLLELSIDLDHSCNSQKTSVTLEIHVELFKNINRIVNIQKMSNLLNMQQIFLTNFDEILQKIWELRNKSNHKKNFMKIKAT